MFVSRTGLRLAFITVALAFAWITMAVNSSRPVPDVPLVSTSDIHVECRLVRGDQVFPLLGFPDAVGKDNLVYAVGYVVNNGVTRAWVTLDIRARSEQYVGSAELTVNGVAAQGSSAEPFIEMMSLSLTRAPDVSQVKPEVKVVEVQTK